MRSAKDMTPQHMPASARGSWLASTTWEIIDLCSCFCAARKIRAHLGMEFKHKWSNGKMVLWPFSDDCCHSLLSLGSKWTVTEFHWVLFLSTFAYDSTKGSLRIFKQHFCNSFGHLFAHRTSNYLWTRIQQNNILNFAAFYPFQEVSFFISTEQISVSLLNER